MVREIEKIEKIVVVKIVVIMWDGNIKEILVCFYFEWWKVGY